MNKNGLNVGQAVFSAVKVVLMVLFLIFEGVPTFIDRLSDGRSIIFAIIELVGSTASIYVVVTILVMVFLMTCFLLGLLSHLFYWYFNEPLYSYSGSNDLKFSICCLIYYVSFA